MKKNLSVIDREQIHCNMGYFLTHSMLRALFTFVLVATFAFLRIGDAHAASVYGTHPYDMNRKAQLSKFEYINVYRTLGYRKLEEFRTSKYRTTTHMLHPYFRQAPYTMYLHEDERKLHPYLALRTRLR